MPGPLIVSLAGTTLLPKERKLLGHPAVGGVVLFKENYNEAAVDPKEDLKKLVEAIRACHPDLLIMVDHEGGSVWRFHKGFTPVGPAKELGALYDQDPEAALNRAYQRGALIARELLSCGIDLSLAPVVDLDGDSNVIGKLSRAFHRDPKIVAEIAAQWIGGMNAEGMPAILKHFPGHGSCKLDSHFEKPVDRRSREALEQDLLPYRVLTQKKGLTFAVMPAHVTYPAVDPIHAAGFSKIWLQDYLRRDCGFNGVIMSDCLAMKGADVGTVLKRIQAAVTAGCDFPMLTHQHGPNLESLMGILHEIPDSKEAQERRAVLAGFRKKKLDSPAALPPGIGGPMLLQFEAAQQAPAVQAEEQYDADVRPSMLPKERRKKVREPGKKAKVK